MALVQGDGYTFDIVEWWSHGGQREGRDGEHYNEGAPNEEDLLNEAVKLTGQITYSDGSVVHYTIHSPDGWLYDELASSVDDAAGYYENLVGGGPPPEPPPEEPPPRRRPRKKRSLFKRILDGWRAFWHQ